MNITINSYLFKYFFITFYFLRVRVGVTISLFQKYTSLFTPFSKKNNQRHSATSDREPFSLNQNR